MKKDIRNSVLKMRSALSKEQVNKLSTEIKDKLISMDEYKKSKCIFAYLDFRNEVATDEIIIHALNNNKRVFIPVCVNETKQLVAAEIDNLSQLSISSYGIREAAPSNIRIADRKLIDIAVVPGAAFDKYGNRLGYGAGYYDRFFHTAGSILKLALAYSFQIVEELGAEPHDVPMDAVITEKEIIRFGRLL